MGQQDSIFRIKGNIDNVNFYKGKNGYGVRKKTGVDAKRIASDPNFARTRENGMEFGRACKASSLLRTALADPIKQAADGGVSRRLTKLMMQVIKSDPNSPRGFRKVTEGDVMKLQGFEFNESSRLATSLLAKSTAVIDRATGNLSINFDPFVPATGVTAPVRPTWNSTSSNWVISSWAGNL